MQHWKTCSGFAWPPKCEAMTCLMLGRRLDWDPEQRAQKKEGRLQGLRQSRFLLRKEVRHCRRLDWIINFKDSAFKTVFAHQLFLYFPVRHNVHKTEMYCDLSGTLKRIQETQVSSEQVNPCLLFVYYLVLSRGKSSLSREFRIKWLS